MRPGHRLHPSPAPGRWITPRAVARAHRLWMEGVPTLEIGRQVHASKNAVIGYARRSGWPRRPNPTQPKGGPSEPASVKSPEPVIHPKPAARPLMHVPPARTCQWVVAEGHRGDGWVFCGERAVPGRSWCLVHYRRCFAPRSRGNLSWLARAA